MSNFDIWKLLVIIAAILLVIFWRRRNAVWGGLILGAIIIQAEIGTGSSFAGYVPLPSYISISSAGGITWTTLDKKWEFKNKLKSNLLILTNRKRTNLTNAITPQEMKARESLRDLISESDWRRYITNGFIMHRGESEKWYQIFNDQKRTNVYWKGKIIETLCLHTDNCPPTDHILNMMTLIDFDENSLGQIGNLRSVNNVNNLADTFVVHGLVG